MRVLIVLVRETLTPITHLQLAVLESHVIDASESLITCSGPSMAESFSEALAEHKRAVCDVADRALQCAASTQVFLGKFPFRFSRVC